MCLAWLFIGDAAGYPACSSGRCNCGKFSGLRDHDLAGIHPAGLYSRTNDGLSHTNAECPGAVCYYSACSFIGTSSLAHAVIS